MALFSTHFQHGANILFDIKTAEDRGFLRQIPDAKPRALIHRQRRDVVAVEIDAAFVGANEAGDHIEHRGLAGAVRAEQTHRLALAHVEADAFDHLAADESLFHAVHGEHALALERRRTVSILAARRRRRGDVFHLRAVRRAVRRWRASRRRIGRPAAPRPRLWRRWRLGLLAAHLARGRRPTDYVQIGAVDHAADAGEVDPIRFAQRGLRRRRVAAAEI